VPSDVSLTSALTMLVDQGEAEAIALAVETDSRIILDDSKARSVARNLGLAVIGTIGVLVKAKHLGVVQLVRPCY
jgi:predicted nucleic acid-binding protein